MPVGRVLDAWGIKGGLKVQAYSSDADALFSAKRWYLKSTGPKPGQLQLAVRSVREQGEGIVAMAEGVDDRNAAEALRGTLLTVPRSALPPLEEGEYYHADLVGLPCEGAGGEPLGRVAAVENFGAGDILDIEKPDGRRTMVPFRPGIADLADGRIVVDPVFLA